MGHYIWIIQLPLSIALGWQDWKSRHVNLIFAIITTFTLILDIHYFYQTLWVLSILLFYQYIRKGSIQPIDIVLFSLGAGYFSNVLLPAYCLLTALALVIVAKAIRKQKLPFIVAWIVGFWGTRIIELSF